MTDPIHADLPADFTELPDLAAERLGGAVIHANDEFFAPKDNLLKAGRAVFIEGKYTDRGKWMDGWETRRRRPFVPGSADHDSALVRLGLPGVLHGVDIDTTHFKGNYPESASIDACAVDGHPDPQHLLGPDTHWVEVLPRAPLRGDGSNLFPLDGAARYTHLRLNIFPDGGVARLRVFGQVVPEPGWPRPGEVDLAAVESGGRVLVASDMFFGARHDLIQPGRPIHMGDGWETRRSRRAGPEWVIVRLSAHGIIHRVEVDTTHFKGNAPESCWLGACDATGPAGVDPQSERSYAEVLPRVRLQPHTRHVFETEITARPAATHARFCIWPDGGVARLRLWGTVTEKGRAETGLLRLNLLTRPAAEAALLACCGSFEWAERMASQRPFRDLAGLVEAGRRTWWALDRPDWLQAFAAHPRIGERKAGAGQAARWSAGEPAGAASATETVRQALAEINKEYEQIFGHPYVVCATGQGAEAMLELARQRLRHPPDVELRVAAEEQQKITDLRLEKLVMQ